MITTNKAIVKRSYGFSELLTKNAKLKKGRARYNVCGLTLAPHKQSGRNVSFLPSSSQQIRSRPSTIMAKLSFAILLRRFA